MKSPRAFTLIELLIVIAIIGILMALLFPLIGSIFRTTKKTLAKNDATQIVAACIAYEIEYGRLPGTNESAANVTGDLVKALMGSNTSTVPNARQIVFLDVNDAKKGKGGIKGNDFVDPWGIPYKVVFDGNSDNEVSAGAAGAFGTNQTVRKKVAVWNDPSQRTGSPTKLKQSYATSWD